MSQLIFASTDGFMMGNQGVGSDDNLLMVIPQPEAQVHVVKHNGQVFIKTSYRIKAFGFHHETGSGRG